MPAILPSSRHSRPFYHHLGIDGHSSYSTQHGHSMNIYTVLPFYKHLCNAFLQSTYLYTGPRHSAHSILRSAAILQMAMQCAILHTSAKCRHSTHIYAGLRFNTNLRSAAIPYRSTQCRQSTNIYAVPPFYTHLRSAAILHSSKQCRHSTHIYGVPPFYTHLRSAAILHT